jgi:N-acetylglutamate synthase-like GNAT family acetyltransferase
MTISWASTEVYDQVREHYQICGYGGGLNDTDQVAVAWHGKIIAAVRICRENGVTVLRGMQVKKEFQRKGIGLAMLRFLQKQMDISGCFCLPYKFLVNFYAQIGFEEISPKDAPSFLAERLEKYHSNGKSEITIMQIKK